jgi:hypothetical protein
VTSPWLHRHCLLMLVCSAQLGDYSGSMLYRLGKRGHRFKCWECGVKKKAPCGDTHRADLPWCCHRRLGANLTLLGAAFQQDHVSLGGRVSTLSREGMQTPRPACPGAATDAWAET